MKALLFCGLVLPPLLLSVQGERVAEQKCKEYRDKTMKTTSAISLVLNPIPITFSSFNCTKTVDLIVGGKDAKPGEFPHQALLGYNKVDASEGYDFNCGGSLISERFVLTAAHCMKSIPKIVRLGEHNLADDTDDQVDLKIETIIRHHNYSIKHSYHDIALVKLAEDVRFSDFIRPACLWTGSPLNTTSVVATGFGVTEIDEPGSNILQKVLLNFLNKTECERQFPRSLKGFSNGIINEQLCVGSDLEGKDTCQGDSGGPIQVVTEPKGCTYHIVGVTSTGSSCDHGKSPAIYTRVASYVSWIESVVWPPKSSSKSKPYRYN